MGTVYDQSEREYRQITEKDVEYFRKVYGDSYQYVQVLEYKRRTDFMINNGDRWDEQIAGIARCLDRIADALENLHQ